MKILQLFSCLRGVHKRDPGLVRDRGNAFVSRCTGCGKAMSKGPRGWQLDDRDE